MKIFIITMDDPIQTNGFIKEIINARKEDIIGLALAKGDRLTVGNKNSKISYFFSLFMIMGFFHFIKNSIKIFLFKMGKYISGHLNFISSPSILNYVEREGMLAFKIKSPNEKKFLEKLGYLNPDIIINQSQCILKKDLLSIPKIGVINRHNALLPKNRGRLSPFWVLYKDENETGVSIHFVETGIDSGDIIVQRKIPVKKGESFNSLVNRSYKIAPYAMLGALDKLENGNFRLIKNRDSEATYNSVPTISEAFKYRIKRIKNFFNIGKLG